MNVSIFGGGWLGQPLATTLSVKKSKTPHSTKRQNCYHVRVTARSEQSIINLTEHGLNAYPFFLGESLLTHKDCAELLNNDVVIINIPPGRRHLADNPQASQQFVADMCMLITQVSINQSAKLIFISTSAVYSDALEDVTEQSEVAPITESGRAHQAIEAFIQQHLKPSACILRLAGLVGPARHPGKFLAGRQHLSGASQVVNLIHQQDVISAIEKIIIGHVWGETLHLAAQAHPSRQEYYTWAANKLGLPAPNFVSEPEPKLGKRIDARYSLQRLSLTLAYPSPYDML